MRTVKWNAFLSGLCAFAAVLGVVASNAHADVTTENGASILVFPKIRVDASFDTVIQIANTSNSMVAALCVYVNSEFTSTITGLPCTVPSATCKPQCQETDFTILLTKAQPTHWLASTGRPFDPTDGFFKDGSGFDPGNVPPVDTTRTGSFLGELKCIQIDPVTGDPTTGNKLKGEATIKSVSGGAGVAGDVSKYNAIGIAAPNGDSTPPPSNPLLLDGNVYNACPARLIMNHFATGAEDPVASDADFDSSSVSTELTLVPCNEDFENQRNTNVTVQFAIYNEFETRFSASTSLSCFLNIELSKIDDPNGTGHSVFSTGGLGSDVGHTEITPVASQQQPPNQNKEIHAVIGIIERTASVASGTNTASSRAAYELFTSGSLVPDPPDQITLPQDEFPQ